MTESGITVVIPLFNKRDFIRRALDSISKQIVAPEEVIVVDDGSTDGGHELVAAYKGLPIRLVRQENAGVSVARNRGVQEAQSEWVAFLDADDEYLPRALHNLCDARDRHPDASVVFGRSISGAPAHNFFMSQDSLMLVPDYFAYLLGRGAYEAHTSSIMVRKSAIEEVGLFPPGVRIGEDTDTWMRLGCLFSFVRVDIPISVYHIEDGDSAWEAQRGADPYWYQTYTHWRNAGRIPSHRLDTAAKYFEFSKLQKVMFLSLNNQRLDAFRKLFTHVRWAAAPKMMLAKTMLIALFPAIVRQIRPGI